MAGTVKHLMLDRSERTAQLRMQIRTELQRESNLLKSAGTFDLLHAIKENGKARETFLIGLAVEGSPLDTQLEAIRHLSLTSGRYYNYHPLTIVALFAPSQVGTDAVDRLYSLNAPSDEFVEIARHADSEEVALAALKAGSGMFSEFDTDCVIIGTRHRSVMSAEIRKLRESGVEIRLSEYCLDADGRYACRSVTLPKELSGSPDNTQTPVQPVSLFDRVLARFGLA